jgi:hypothetical protein
MSPIRTVWAQIHADGTQMLENIANIRAPLICAVEGKAWIHSEYCLLANVIVAGEGASFNDFAALQRRHCPRRRGLHAVVALRRPWPRPGNVAQPAADQRSGAWSARSRLPTKHRLVAEVGYGLALEGDQRGGLGEADPGQGALMSGCLRCDRRSGVEMHWSEPTTASSPP